MMNRILGLGFILLSSFGFSQTDIDVSQVNRYFIYFTDKSSDNYPYSISNPEMFLTQRAIDRRSKQDIPVVEEDLPVDPSYTQGLSDAGVDVYFTSRWFNGALVNMDTTLLDDVAMLSYVDSIALIADTTRLSRDQDLFVTPTDFNEPSSVSGNSDIQLIMLGADHMHLDDIKGQGMLIAVLDNGFTGVDRYTPFQHLWENNKIIATKDFVQNSGNVFQFGSHGTSVFSIIGANFRSANDDLIGITPEAEFILCITEDNAAENRVEEYNWLLGVEYADSLGADVINASLGYNTFDIPEHNYSKDDLDGVTSIVSRAASIAAQKGMIVVTSAGNSGRSSAPNNLMSHPADATNILAVGSVNHNFGRSDFSSVGPTADGRIKPDVAAFGDGTAIMRGSGDIERGGGTSFASPLIAGFAAGIWQANPEWTSQQVMDAIKNSGHRAYAPDSFIGYGVPTYAYAVDGKALNVQDILSDKVAVYPNPFSGDTLFLITEGVFKKGMNIKILDPKGSLVFEESYKRREIKERMELNIGSSEQGVYFLFLQTGNSEKVVKLINF